MLRKSLANSVAAGIIIGIGGVVYLSCEINYIGAVLFTVGLLAVCALGLYLYTGKVGFLVNSHKLEDFAVLGLTFIGNVAGVGITALLARTWNADRISRAAQICANKLELSYGSAFCSAVLCGVLMYTAVKIYRGKGSIAGILFCVPVFILSGFEHSIADVFYFFFSGVLSWRVLAFVVVVVAGNSVGACIIPALLRIAGEE